MFVQYIFLINFLILVDCIICIFKYNFWQVFTFIFLIYWLFLFIVRYGTFMFFFVVPMYTIFVLKRCRLTVCRNILTKDEYSTTHGQGVLSNLHKKSFLSWLIYNMQLWLINPTFLPKLKFDGICPRTLDSLE